MLLRKLMTLAKEYGCVYNVTTVKGGETMWQNILRGSIWKVWLCPVQFAPVLSIVELIFKYISAISILILYCNKCFHNFDMFPYSFPSSLQQSQFSGRREAPRESWRGWKKDLDVCRLWVWASWTLGRVKARGTETSWSDNALSLL